MEKMMRSGVLILGLLAIATPSFSMTCDDNEMADEFCADLMAAEDCLDANYRCDRYTAGAMVQSILLLGKIDVAARHFHRQGQLQGEVGDRFARFCSFLSDQSWDVTSRDANWLVAAQRIIDLTQEYADRLGELN